MKIDRLGVSGFMFQVARANAVTEWPLRELLFNRPAVMPILSDKIFPEIEAPPSTVADGAVLQSLY